ncbi:MAG: ATP-binding cassette domain-containing protein [Eubacteriales bacterium]|nr:ATP-binding cassette domain-containing protein [Eubacteriales bacterium]
MLKFQNVSIYQKKRKIVDNLNLELSDGVIFGLVGSDEIAKTAILRAAAGCQAPEKGRIFLGEQSVYPVKDTFLHTGYMTKNHVFYDQLSVEEYYELFLALYKVNGRYRKRRVKEVLNLLEMEQFSDTLLGEIPEEYKPFLALGKTILHEPSWLLLDHPFQELNMSLRKRMLDVLDMLWEQGISLVLSTEIFPEITPIMENIAVIENGQIVSSGTIESVYEKALRENPIRMRILDGMEAALQVFRQNDLVYRVTVDHERVMILFSGGDKEEAELLSDLIKAGTLIQNFQRETMNLDQMIWG